MSIKEREKELLAEGFELDLFSTILSRKHALHVCCGVKRYVKVVKEVKK